MKNTLIIGLNQETIAPIREALSTSTEVEAEINLDIGVSKFKKNRYEYTFIDIDLLRELAPESHTSYKQAISFLQNFHPQAPIIVFSDSSKLRETVQAVKDGATDYLITPIKPEEVSLITNNINSKDIEKAKLDYFRDQFWNEKAADLVVTQSKAMREVYQKVKSVARTSSTVLLTGETGVGKSLVARLIHEHSNRKKGPFVSVHCGAIPETLVESELFGHEKGAFTGAIKRKLGRFEIANHGTIFLDEIGTVSQSTQIKLLHVLQESLFQRVGGESDIKVDVRIIAATNENLKELCVNNKFRNDLYYRLNVFPIDIPPLSERREDIQYLCDGFLRNLNSRYGKSMNSISERAIEALQNYGWPGNIRELENVIERAYIIETSKILRLESLPLEMTENLQNSAVISLNISNTLAEVRNKAIEDVERQYLKDLLSKHHGKVSEVADIAGVGIRQIHKLMVKYNLTKKDFKE